MTRETSFAPAHPPGEQPEIVESGAPRGVEVDTWASDLRVEWDQEAAMTPLGQLPFLLDFLETSGLFDALVTECPLHYRPEIGGNEE